jgi:predicted transcriptional regulator
MLNREKKEQIDEIASMLVCSTKDVNISLVNLKAELVDRIKLTSEKDS